MRSFSFAGILGFLVFLALFAWLAGDYIDEVKTNATKCTDARQALGLCTK